MLRNGVSVLIACCITASLFAQNNTLPDQYLKVAEFRKAQNDSAMVYYLRAAVEYHKTVNADGEANAYTQAANILIRQNSYGTAKLYLEKALFVGQSSLDSNSLTIAGTCLSLGVLYGGLENYEQSLFYHNKALTIRLLKLGEFNADVATSYGNIGNIYFRNKNNDAIRAHLKAMKIREKLLGKTSPEVSQSYANLGNAYKDKADYAKALEYYDKALQNKILQLGPTHKDLAKYYGNVSDMYLMTGNKEKGALYKAKKESVSSGN